LLHKRQVYVCS